MAAPLITTVKAEQIFRITTVLMNFIIRITNILRYSDQLLQISDQ